MASVIALSILYVKYPSDREKKQSYLIYIYKFDNVDNARTFKHQSISLFKCLENFLEKDKAGVPF